MCLTLQVEMNFGHLKLHLNPSQIVGIHLVTDAGSNDYIDFINELRTPAESVILVLHND